MKFKKSLVILMVVCLCSMALPNMVLGDAIGSGYLYYEDFNSGFNAAYTGATALKPASGNNVPKVLYKGASGTDGYLRVIQNDAVGDTEAYISKNIAPASQQITVEFDINLQSVTGTNNFIMFIQGDKPDGAIGNGIRTYFNTNIRTDNGASLATAASTFSSQKWHHMKYVITPRNAQTSTPGFYDIYMDDMTTPLNGATSYAFQNNNDIVNIKTIRLGITKVASTTGEAWYDNIRIYSGTAAPDFSAGAAVRAANSPLVYDNFDSMPLYEGPVGYTAPNVSSNGTALVTARGTNGRYVRITNSATASGYNYDTYVTKTITEQTQPYTVEWDLINEDYSLITENNTPHSTGVLWLGGTAIRTYTSNTVKVYNGNTTLVVAAPNVELKKWHHFKMDIDPTASPKSYKLWLDGKLIADNYAFNGTSPINQILFGVPRYTTGAYNMTAGFDNVLIYNNTALKKIAVLSTEDNSNFIKLSNGQTNVSTATQRILIKFEGIMDVNSFNKDTIKFRNDKGEEVSYNIVAVDTRTASIEPVNPLAGNTSYRISFSSDLKSNNSDAYIEQDLLSFTTGKAFVVDKPVVKDGETTINSITPDINGKTLTASAEIINKSGIDKNAVIILAYYRNGFMEDMNFYEKTVPTSTQSQLITCDLEMPSNTSGISIKAFVWDDLVNIEPFSVNEIIE